MGGPTSASAVSAPGKVLLAGGYLVLDRAYTGFVFGLSARINVVAQEIQTSPGIQLSEMVVESPQFLDGHWTYGYHLAPEDGGIKVTQLQVGAHIRENPFVETTLSYSLSYISHVAYRGSSQSMHPVRLTILADSDYYSSTATTGSTRRFVRFATRLSDAHKTGLGSSAALVTALTAALLTHYLGTSFLQEDDEDAGTGRSVLHNLAQAAHCAAQGKVGSGFDVAAAVYGSCRYRRFDPAVLAGLSKPGDAGFGSQLARLVRTGTSESVWGTEIDKDGVSLPIGVTLRMCDVDCGSQTVGMVKKVLAWRKADVEGAKKLWDELQRRNETLAAVLKGGRTEDIRAAVRAVRELLKNMGAESGVPIEPESQTELLDALEGVDGVYGGVVPGAGGYDALALLLKDDDETIRRAEDFLEVWSKEKGGRVKLLAVKGEMEGVRLETMDTYKGWFGS